MKKRVFLLCILSVATIFGRYGYAQLIKARGEKLPPKMTLPKPLLHQRPTHESPMQPTPHPTSPFSLRAVTALSRPDLANLYTDSKLQIDGRMAYALNTLNKQVTGPYASFNDQATEPYLGFRITGPGRVGQHLYRIENVRDDIVERGEASMIYSPQFSPDGRYISFKFGEPDTSYKGEYQGSYRLYVLDTTNGHYTQVSDRDLSYDMASWSPDGRYIAYVDGGDFGGSADGYRGYIGPLKLYVCDWRNKKEHLVATNDSIRGPFGWLPPHTLLYGAMSDQGQEQLYQQKQVQEEEKMRAEEEHSEALQPLLKKIRGKKPPRNKPQPDLFKYAIGTPSPKKLFKNGYFPVVSPNRKWVAFFGAANPNRPIPLLSEEWESSPHGLSLCVAHLNGTHRTALYKEGENYPDVCWLPGNQYLVALTQVQSPPTARAEVKVWNVRTRKHRDVVTISANDAEDIAWSLTTPQFRILGTNKSGSALFVSVATYEGNNSEGYAMLKTALESVDLRTGKVTVMAHALGGSSIDWQGLN